MSAFNAQQNSEFIDLNDVILSEWTRWKLLFAGACILLRVCYQVVETFGEGLRTFLLIEPIGHSLSAEHLKIAYNTCV